MNPKRCATCIYVGPEIQEATIQSQAILTCHFLPPTVSIILMPMPPSPLGRNQMGPMPFTAWPQVKEGDLCGQFEEKVVLQ